MTAMQGGVVMLSDRRRKVNTPALTSNNAVPNNPHGVSVGGGAFALRHRMRR
jgi:hypothetical protein